MRKVPQQMRMISLLEKLAWELFPEGEKLKTKQKLLGKHIFAYSQQIYAFIKIGSATQIWRSCFEENINWQGETKNNSGHNPKQFRLEHQFPILMMVQWREAVRGIWQPVMELIGFCNLFCSPLPSFSTSEIASTGLKKPIAEWEAYTGDFP